MAESTKESFALPNSEDLEKIRVRKDFKDIKLSTETAVKLFKEHFRENELPDFLGCVCFNTTRVLQTSFVTGFGLLQCYVLSNIFLLQTFKVFLLY